MIHRAKRHTRADNEAKVNAYGNLLDRQFRNWMNGNHPIHALIESWQSAAEAHFAEAYLRGKRQALRRARMEIPDRIQIRELLDSNRHYLEYSLGTAIERRKAVLAATREDPTLLGRTFGARIRNQYGGRLWNVQETGYLAGSRELAQRIRMRAGRRPLFQAVIPQNFPDQGEADFTDADLADSMGMTVAEFQDLIDQIGPGTEMRSGTEYNTEEDKDVCDECQGNRDDGEDGIYWLPDEPPIPGSNCSGGQSCRCWCSSVTEIA